MNRFLFSVLLIMTIEMFVSSVALAEIKAKPYGFILVNSSYNSETLADIPVFAPPEGTGNRNFIITPRQTRVGLKATSDARFKPSGVVEIDFWGLRGSQDPTGATQTALRLRRAFLMLSFDRWDFLVGQEWMVFSPLKPTTLMHQSVTGLTASGNLWARLPQMAGLFRLVDGDRTGLDLNLALTRPFGADQDPSPVLQLDQLGAGEKSGLPFLQGRMAYSRHGDSVQFTLGAGIHAGTEDFGKDADGSTVHATTLAAGGDLTLSMSAVTFQGEGYYGENIPMLFSAAAFVVDTTGGSLAVDEVEATGGWGEVSWKASALWVLAASAGVESLDDTYLTAGSVKENFTLMATGIWNPVEPFKVGGEVGYIETTRIVDGVTKATDGGASNVNVNLSFQYVF